jgi:hypothetical protein
LPGPDRQLEKKRKGRGEAWVIKEDMGLEAGKDTQWHISLITNGPGCL